MAWSLVLALAMSQAELPPEARLVPPPPPPAPPSAFTRTALATGGGALASGVSLGIALLLVGSNPLFDPTFANAALASLLITGVGFSIHQALGGRGEITLAFLFAAVVMAGAAAIASAVDGTPQLTPIITTAIGALPAAAAAVLGLEFTTPQRRPAISLVFGPTGVVGTF